MVTVTLYLQAAGDILEMFRSAKVGKDFDLEKIVNSPEYDFFLRRHRYIGKIHRGEDLPYEKEELRSVLKAVVRGEAYTSPVNKYFDHLSAVLLKAADDLVGLEARIESLNKINWEPIQKAIRAVAPDSNINPDVPVYIAPDAHLSAYVHQGSIGVSLMQIDANQGNPILKVELPKEFTKTPEPVVIIFPIDDMLAHEVHHLIYAKAGNTQGQKSPLQELADGIQGEGMATWFFSMPRKNTSMEEYWQITEEKIDEHFLTFVQELWQLASSEPNPQRAIQALFAPPPGGGTELVYVLGANFCRAIELAFGREMLLNLTAQCPEFYKTYNLAAEKLNGSDQNTWPGASAQWPLLPQEILDALAG